MDKGHRSMKHRTDFWEIIEDQYANLEKNKRQMAACDKGEVRQGEGRQGRSAEGTQKDE